MPLGEFADRRRSRRPVPGAEHAPSPRSPAAAAVLALQQGAGNHATARLLSTVPAARLQRWSVAAIDEQRRQADLATRGTFGGVALHHIISKERLTAMALDLNRDMGDDDPDVAAAAKEFWAETMKGVPKEVAQQAGDMAATLHNLPLNLEAGPLNPGGNPGTGIDPVTQSVPGSDRQAHTAGSAALLQVDAGYTELRLDPSKRAANWKMMAKQMKAAHEASPARQVGIHTDMWFLSGDEFYRKGERAFPGLEGGQERFTDHLNAAVVENIAGFHDSPTVVASTTRTCQRAQPVRAGRARGRNAAVAPQPQVTFTVDITEGLLEHSCVRHTYRHFDFNQIKAVNNFWPRDFDYSDLLRLAPVLVDGIADHLRDLILDKLANYTDSDDLKSQSITGHNVKAGQHQIFFIANLEYADQEGEDFTWDVLLDTLAPDGKSADSYTIEELENI